jgi:excisionase family DNA binding protein
MESANNTPAQLHTVEEVMARLCVGRSTAFALIGSRQLRSVKVGRRRLVSEAAIVEFIENLDRHAPSES